MRRWSIAFAALIGSAAAPASAALTVDIDPTLARGTRTINIFDTSGGGPCGPFLCPGSGTSFYETIVDTNAATQVASINPNELRFTFQDRSRSQTTISLLFTGPNGGGTFLSSSLAGFQELGAPCFGGGQCRTDTTNFSAVSFAVRITDTSTGLTRFMAPVPEPSTWVMMLVGFGAIGAAMRRGRRAKVLFTTA